MRRRASIRKIIIYKKKIPVSSGQDPIIPQSKDGAHKLEIWGDVRKCEIIPTVISWSVRSSLLWYHEVWDHPHCDIMKCEIIPTANCSLFLIERRRKERRQWNEQSQSGKDELQKIFVMQLLINNKGLVDTKR